MAICNEIFFLMVMVFNGNKTRATAKNKNSIAQRNIILNECDQIFSMISLISKKQGFHEEWGIS